MSPAEMFVGLGVLGTICTAIVTAGRVQLRKAELKQGGRSLPADVERRLERIEQAVDAIAIEVERVSEGQRFTTKLLSNKGPAQLPSTSKPDSP
jgi:hypothetical protein